MRVDTGLMDHMTSRCFGVNDRTDDTREARGHCVHTNSAGDRIVTDHSSNGKYPKDAKSFEAAATITTGTGGYTGISGTIKGVCHGSRFGAPTEGGRPCVLVPSDV